jgi:hypothetical protein
MPYDKPDPDNACENCAGGPVYGGSTHCAGCECPDPEFVRSGVQEQELGYHWSPVYWTCDLCGERAMADAIEEIDERGRSNHG